MNKPGALRAHLVAAMPELARDPERFSIYIERGSLTATFAKGLSFEYRYTLVLTITDFSRHPDAVVVPLLVWLRTEQPELLANPDRNGSIGFEVDVLDNNTVDLELKLPLTERVGVHPRATGGYDVTHYPEPQLEPVLQATEWQVFLRDELLTTFTSPPA